MDKSVPAGAAKLLDFIGSIEAPKGYDTVYGNKMRRMPKPLTSMTFDEVVQDGPRRRREFGSSACGRYQFMRDTLDAQRTAEDIKGQMKLSGKELFTPDLQDRMGYHLLKRRGYGTFMAGRMTAQTFGLKLAQEWASFPVLAATQGAHRPVSRGETYYAGDKLNKVLTKPEAVEAILRQIRPSGASKPASDRMATGEAPTISPLPTVPTVPVPPTPVVRPWWQRLLGFNKPVPDARPGLAPNGDPALWDIQATLKRLKYPVGLLDGRMGKNTRTAISQARERNGLPPGEHLDDAFKAALPGMLPAEVSEERANAPPERLRQEAPEATRQLDGLGLIGKLILGASGLGAADATGALNQVKALADQSSETLASIQTVVTFVVTAIQWCITHWWVLGIIAGVVVLWKVAMAGLRLLVLLRQGRLL